MNHTDLQELGAEIKIYGEIEDQNMRHFNPSIAWHQGKLKIALRSCNFAVVRGGKWYLRDGSAYSKTDVILGELDPDSLNVTRLRKLRVSDNSPVIVKTAGLEDARLFSRKDGLHAIGFVSDRLTRSLHNGSAALAEYLIEGDELKYLRTFEKPKKDWPEKNWNPTEVHTENFDLTYSDTQVYKDGKLIGEPSKTNIHGGSQLLKHGNGWISIVHEKIAVRAPIVRNQRYGRTPNIYDKYVYYTYLAIHDEQGIIKKLSHPFRFGTLENIEFASGLVRHNDEFLITFGIRDCKWAVCKIPCDKLLALIEKHGK